MAVEEDQEPSNNGSNNNCVCVVQYVLFPPHNTTSYVIKDRCYILIYQLTFIQLLDCILILLNSVSEDEATEESDIMDANDAQLEIVTECWVESQAGVAVDSFRGLDYTSLAESVSLSLFFLLSAKT